MLVGYFFMKSPCNRICKLNDEQICIGCGRSWEEIRDWMFYTNKERDVVMERVKDYKSQVKSKFDDTYCI
jgi:predicted Fe-S protein YdhL (DUF1289 family)